MLLQRIDDSRQFDKPAKEAVSRQGFGPVALTKEIYLSGEVRGIEPLVPYFMASVLFLPLWTLLFAFFCLAEAFFGLFINLFYISGFYASQATR
jgi:hypothetical protein